MRKLFLLPLLLFVLLGLAQAALAQSGIVLVLEIDGPVTPAMADYFQRGIREAENRSANALVIQLNTPGGALDTTLDIVQSFRNADVPIIVYVTPSGAQAASAGSIITAAAHASGMAPQTVIGAASPINSDGSDINETAFRKAVEDMKATMRTLTAHRGEEAVELAEAMIEDARAVSSEEALTAGFIDVIAVDLDDLLAQLDGRPVLIKEQTVILETADAAQENLNRNLGESILHALANPIIVGILMAIGVQAIIIEISNPGGWIAGLIGVLFVGLGLYGLGQLPVNWLGLGLIIVAFILFIAEVLSANHGALALAGVLCLLGGLLVLFNSPGTPEFARISIPAAVAITGVSAAFFLFIMSKALGAQRKETVTGAEGMVGKTGPVRQSFQVQGEDGRYKGTVLVNGELWQAQADETIPFGVDVVVTAMDGFELVVEKAEI
ncbi:MAG: nodulation protein NfeD [Chloroflexi bacterium]|nr:nodulation protein NfeD [Chloroflexota bacterium]